MKRLIHILAVASILGTVAAQTLYFRRVGTWTGGQTNDITVGDADARVIDLRAYGLVWTNATVAADSNIAVRVVRSEAATRYDSWGTKLTTTDELIWSPAVGATNELWLAKGDTLRLIGPTNGTVYIHLLRP